MEVASAAFEDADEDVDSVVDVEVMVMHADASTVLPLLDDDEAGSGPRRRAEGI